ncbi:MAG: S8 family serine peptidase, partial [Phycisphaerales bacterium]
MVRGATRFAACAALALGLVAAAFSSQAHAQTPLPPKGSAPAGESQGPAGPGSIIGDPGGAPVVRPAIRPQSLLGRETNAASIRGEVVMRQNGQRMTYQVVTPNGEQINQATMLGLTQRAGQPVYAVGVNELLVGFRNPTTLAEATAFFRQHGLTGEVTRKALLRDVFMVRTDTALRAFQAGDAFVSDARVRFAHPDLYAEMRTTDPELQLMQGMTTIMSGGMYDFGMTTQGTPVSADFTITNTGDMGLSLSVGSVPTGFTVNTPFPANPIPPGGTFDFTVTLDAEMAGAPNGDLEILNNTATNPFVITLSGMVNMPMGPADLRVTLMGAEVDNGSNVSFGTTSTGAAVVRTFTIHNDGGDPLTIGAVSVPGGFTVTSQPMGPVAGGTSTVFSVQLDALMDGTYTGQLSFLNNDADDNPYTITISGTVSTGGSGEEIDDPLYVDQWHLNNTGQGNGVEMVDINAEAAWALTLGDGALIAIMDSSIQPDHPDYAGNVVPCVDCVNFFDLPSNPDTGIGNHGTAVTGLVAAVDNMIGVRGGAPNANVIVTSYIGLDGNGLSVAETAENWAAAAAEGASVHTNSWGYSNETFLPDISRDTIIDLTNNARDGRGMLFLFATANSFTLTTYGSALASMEETLGVSGVGNDGERAIYANYGLGADVTGPTEGNDLAITTTDVTGEGGYNDDPSESGGDYTNSFNGTSASTPIIAGVAALAISENENLHAAQLKRLLLHTASANAARNTLLGVENLGFSGITSFSESYGYGMPDARAAVAAARQSISNGNLTWPATARNLTVNASATATSIMWTNPPAGPKGEFAGALVVRLGPDVAWKPVDGITYTVGDNPAEGVTVVAVGNITSPTDMGNTTRNSPT